MKTKQFTMFLVIDAPEDWSVRDIEGYYIALLDESTHGVDILEIEETGYDPAASCMEQLATIAEEAERSRLELLLENENESKEDPKTGFRCSC